MGVEPAFTPNTSFWPLTGGLGSIALEPEDPRPSLPRGGLDVGTVYFPLQTLQSNADEAMTPAAREPLSLRSTVQFAHRRRWLLAIIASLVLHVSAALFFIQSNSDDVLIEGGEQAHEAALGSADADQSAAGEPAVNVSMVTMLDAMQVEPVDATPVAETATVETPETVPAEVAETEVAQPVETVPEQPQQPVEKAEPEQALPQPTEPVVETAEQSVVSDTPEILTAERVEPVQDDNVVVKPAEQVAAARIEPEPEPVKPVKKVEARKPVAKAQPEKAKPVERPAKKPVEKAAKAEKAEKAAAAKKEPGKTKTAKAGTGGKNSADMRQGQADGAQGGKNAKGTGKRSSAAGNAAVSNYPGKVVSKLRRALRYPAEARRERLRGEVQVAFTVSAGGGVGGIRVVRSSGSPVLDQAAIETVRRAAPFPAIPEDAGRSSWPFTVPLAFMR